MIQHLIGNISKAISTGLNVSENQFIIKDTFYSPEDEDEDTTNKFSLY